MSDNRYNHLEVEKKWQKFWEENKTFSVENVGAYCNTPLQKKEQKTFYALDMFPFPSGAGLHVGHPEGYTATDIICRKKRMEGYKVLHPMGWDAFGLPAENFAIKTGIHPKISTEKNIKNFTRQIKSLGFSYDWNREFSTTDEDYYKWTQWLFLKFYEKGLLYEDEKPLNWCPSCKVVCANEEVEQGMHERCGTPVTKKSLKQWMFKITEYAERLLQDLDLGKKDENFNFCIPSNKELAECKNIAQSVNRYNDDFIDRRRFIIAKEKKSEKIAAFAQIQKVGKVNEFTSLFVTPEFRGKKLGYQILDSLMQKGKYKEVYFDSFNHLEKYYLEMGAKKITPPEEMIDRILTKRVVEGKPIDKEEVFKEYTFFRYSVLDREVLDWPEKIKAMQRNWIGKSTGANVDFKIINSEKISEYCSHQWIWKDEKLHMSAYGDFTEEDICLEKKLTIYTTRPDTLMGATYMVISPEHPLIERVITEEKKNEVEKYQKICSAKSELERTELNKEKTGVFTGGYAINPITKELIPIWIADYVLMTYGTGAIMAVPAHDERDFEFAKKYNIPIRRTIVSNREKYGKKFDELCDKIKEETGDLTEEDLDRVDIEAEILPYIEKEGELGGIYVSNAEICRTEDHTSFPEKEDEEKYNRLCDMLGKPVSEVIEMMIQYLEDFGIGQREINYRLRDWIFTRQRYWGEPIPLVFDEEGKCYPLDESELPLVLPESANYEPSETGESPLAKIENWVNVKGDITEKGTVKISAKGNKNFRRETSTMPNWAGSSWYWLRYMDAKNSEKPWSKDAEKQWGPVDLYVGGAEHAVLHLLYARFWHKALYDMGLVSTKEPFKKLVNQGLILSYAYENPNGGLVPVDEVTEKNGKFFDTEGNELKKIVAKMSKSLKNVVNPDEIVEAFGADTLRMYEMFMGPFEQNKAWETTAVEGMYKFLTRIWRNFSEKEIVDVCPSDDLIRLTHQTVKKVSDDIDDFKFNTAISQLMVWMNAFQKLDHIPRIAGGKFIRLLSPFAPHLAEEIWQKFSPQDETISFTSWPSYHEKYLVSDTVKYAVQVNGKLRGDFEISKQASREECLEVAKKLEKVEKYLLEGEIKKEIFVPGKIIGFVVK